ncbi:H-NS family nucleoid-associated regulatory protein [Vogesella sp. LIG4]|uniref:H-NS histone family protein n=1 Tax=Vogesella sp. LIG4 TaxID=1192162 RepID=UPI00081F7C97|nr:H-NS histone family protein [Vogesella sp. LIG4]SCK30392.1 DNA-binding protein H-NS [Vogesella sp. LIG4]
MDLSTLDFAGLLQLRTDVDAEIRRRESEEKAKAAKQVMDLIRTHGLDIQELATKSVKSPASGTRKPVDAKYRHPDDASLSWTGRGRKPLWVVTWLDSGRALDDLLIK